MARKLVNKKKLIFIFCEGESEQAYAEFLKERFYDVASIRYPAAAGLFDTARNKFRNEARYRNNVEEIDEIWFFFDVEESDHGKWSERYAIIQELRKMKRRPNIRVRLLMTTACVEYWFMLHYQMFAPAISTVPDKERIRHLLETRMPGYKKGDKDTINKIAEHYSTAVRNGSRTFHNLLSEGLPTLEDTDDRNFWLYQSSKTFTTVQEAIVYLESL